MARGSGTTDRLRSGVEWLAGYDIPRNVGGRERGGLDGESVLYQVYLSYTRIVV